MRGLLSEFALGPAWARGGSDPQTLKPRSAPETRGGEREPRRGDRGDRGNRGEQDRSFRERDERRPGQGRRENYAERREGPPQRQEEEPAVGVRVTLNPDPQAIHLIGREVHQVARVYPLFEIARILLAERGRCRAVFEVEAGYPSLFAGKLDESLFLTRDEAVRHLWHSELSKQLIEEETIEVDPPAGRFQAVARCGISGSWLGPPNHHSYQTNLRRLHRERFGNMPFEVYAAKVRTERSEEAVNAWLETMKQKVRWRIKGEDDNAWIDNRVEAERAVATRCFETAFAEVRTAEISGAIPAKNISPALLTSLCWVGSHARQHPAIMIPAVCRALEAEHLPVFKRLGKLHTGPARPHSLDPEVVLAERPAAMVEWIRNNSPAKLAGLWQAVLPEGTTEPTQEFAADLFWLLHQGHVLLYADDKLAMQEPREATPPKKDKKPKTPKPLQTDQPVAAIPSDEAAIPPIIAIPADAPKDESDLAMETVLTDEPVAAIPSDEAAIPPVIAIPSDAPKDESDLAVEAVPTGEPEPADEPAGIETAAQPMEDSAPGDRSMAPDEVEEPITIPTEQAHETVAEPPVAEQAPAVPATTPPRQPADATLEVSAPSSAPQEPEFNHP